MTLPLIILHGALSHAGQFQNLRERLPADWSVYVLNFPGHGGLPADKPFSMHLFAKAVLDFMDEGNFQEVNIFGYSMGGYVALALAAEHPERVRQVVTLGTKLDWSPEVAAGMGRMFDPEKIEAKVPQFAQTLKHAHAPADWKIVCRRTSDFLRDLGDGKGIAADTFTQISRPVTIGWGELDNVVSREESERVAGQLPKGRFKILPGMKHPIEQVDADQLAALLVAELTA